MKFSNGMWTTREGYSFYWADHAARTSVTGDEASLLLSKKQNWVGDSINIPTLTGRIRSPAEGIIAAKFSHWDGEEDPGPNFPLAEQQQKDKAVVVDHQDGKDLRVDSGSLALSVNTASNSLTFKYAERTPNEGSPKHLTGHSYRSIGLVRSQDCPRYDINDGLFAEKKNYMLVEFDLSIHETIYGLGERFGPFIKNGQSVDLWNEDGGTSSEQTYKNIPFLMSSRGYGIFFNHSGKLMLEVQSERTTRINVAVEGESLEYMIIAGPTPKDVLNRYTRLTGRPPLPPAWSYGLWLTTSFQTDYSENNVTSFLDGLIERDIHLSVFHFDALWMKPFHWCDFEFDEKWFPDPSGYMSRMKQRGLKICVWINPYVAQASPMYGEGKKNGYFIMRNDTVRPTVFQWDEWQAGNAIVDFTNPEACKWFIRRLQRLMDMGVDSFKTDFGERIPFKPGSVKYWDGSDPLRMHNFYPYLYNKYVWECIRTHSSHASGGAQAKDNPVLFARSATAGCQQFPVHWGGDCESTFPAMAETLRGGLSLSVSGFGYWAHDIGGFEGLPDPSLYKRWVQFGLLSSHSRLHGSSSYRVPWIFEESHPGEGDKCSAVLRQAVKRKMSLMPYVLRAALEVNHKGTPIMRPMFLEFPDDFNAWGLDTQYMFGGDLLVAPVLSPEGWVRFYVPEVTSEAKWRSWFDPSKTYDGGKWVRMVSGSRCLYLANVFGTVRGNTRV